MTLLQIITLPNVQSLTTLSFLKTWWESWWQYEVTPSLGDDFTLELFLMILVNISHKLSSIWGHCMCDWIVQCQCLLSRHCHCGAVTSASLLCLISTFLWLLLYYVLLSEFLNFHIYTFTIRGSFMDLCLQNCFSTPQSMKKCLNLNMETTCSNTQSEKTLR